MAGLSESSNPRSTPKKESEMGENLASKGSKLKDEPAYEFGFPLVEAKYSQGSSWKRFKRNVPAKVSACLLTAIVLVVIAWPVVLKLAVRHGARGAQFAQQYGPDTLSDNQFVPPGAAHWFG